MRKTYGLPKGCHACDGCRGLLDSTIFPIPVKQGRR
jgi:hypothetical protein